MAGQPRMRQLEIDIANKPDGEEWVYDQLADGRSVREVAMELGVSRRYLYQWRDKQKERRKPLWEAAIRMSAEAHLENSMADFDRLDREIEVDPVTGEEQRRVPHPSEVQLVTGRAKFRQWLAARNDPERYGDKAGVEVNLNLGDLHLAALAEVKQRHALPAPVVEAEIIEEGGDELDALR